MSEHESNIKSLPSRTNVLGVGVSALDMTTAVEALINACLKNLHGYVCVTGVHGVIESQRDDTLRLIHNGSYLTVPDGMPTVWMGREQGFTKMGRVYGPDLMLRLMEATSNQALGTGQEALGKCQETSSQRPTPGTQRPLTHFLYGATPEMIEKLKTNLEDKFPGVIIVGTYAPPFRPLNDEEERALAALVSDLKPDFFWVGLSTPKQETFMAAHDPRALGARHLALGKETPDAECTRPSVPYPLECGIMLGVGAAFPIHAGLQKDAPEWVKNSGLQWFHRLCQEPRRLWRRYLDIVPTFLWLAFLQLLGIKKYSLND